MSECPDSDSPPTEVELRALVRVFYLRQASAWAAVVWFPLALILVSLDAAGWALGVLISGAAFSGILRVVVGASRCPRCSAQFSSTSGGLRDIWHHDRCGGCGLRRFRH